MQRASPPTSPSGQGHWRRSDPSTQQPPLLVLRIAHHTCRCIHPRIGAAFRAASIGFLLFATAPSIASAQAASQRGLLCGTTIKAPVAEYSLTVADKTLGPVAQDSLSPHFYNAAGTITSNSQWTKPTSQYFAAVETTFSTHSRYCSRDVEVTTWSRNGIVFLRTTTDGRAIYFMYNGEPPGGFLEVGLVANLDVTAGYRYAEGGGNFYPLYETTSLSLLAAGYDETAVQARTFTFGVEGFDIYAALNGVEFLRFQDYRHMDAGRVATQNNAGYGFASMWVRNLAQKQLRSTYHTGRFDLADFGLRELHARGTIATGSSRLELATNPGFQVGDHIIVATGGERGRGKRGTAGVGGTWPETSYTSVDVMQRDGSRSVGSYAWVESTGVVYRQANSEWVPLTGAYYIQKAIPRALSARIVEVSQDGRVLTLDRPAVAAARNATVHFDNQPVVQKLLGNPRFAGEMNYPSATRLNDLTPLTPSDLTWLIPRGSYALGNSVILERHTGWRLQGSGRNATTFFSPRGAPSAMLWVLFAPVTTVSDLHIRGNARDDGFMLSGDPQFLSDATVRQGHAYPSGILLGQQSHGSRVERAKVTDVFQRAVGAEFCDDCWAQDVDVLMTDGLRDYIQWMYQWSDSVGGGCVDCSLTSPYLTAGFEGFKSKGVQFIRPFGVNAIVAMNSSGAFSIEDGMFIIQWASEHPDGGVSAEEPVVNINSNIGDHPFLAYGGLIRNIMIIHEGYVNSQNDIMAGVVVNVDNPNIVIEGGLYDAPKSRSPSRGVGARGLISTGANLIVDGFRVNGRARGDGLYGANIGFSRGVVRNCVADVVRTTDGLIVDCSTTREADAKKPWASPLVHGQSGAPCIVATWGSVAGGKALGVRKSWSRPERCQP